METPAPCSLCPGEPAILPGSLPRRRSIGSFLPVIVLLSLLALSPAGAISGHETLLMSPNITLNENSEKFTEFSNFFVLDEDRVVWMNVWSERKSDGALHTDTIYLMNITTNTTRAIARAPDASHPWTLFPPFSVSGNVVAYTELSNSDIYLFDITEGTEHRLTNDGALESLDETRGNADPAVDGDRIVWSKKKPYNQGHDADIVMQNLTTGELREICTAQGDQVDPRISGTKVVWRDMRDESGGRGGDIYLYDLATGTEIAVCTAQDLQQQADVYGDTVVWSDFRDGNPAIYLYNLTTGTETRISDPFTNAYQPRIDENVVAWGEYSPLDRQDDPSRYIALYDLRTGTRQRLDVASPSSYLHDLDAGRVLYSVDLGDKTREKGYLHLYVIDTPANEKTTRTATGPVTPGGGQAAVAGNDTVSLTNEPSTAGLQPPTRPAPGFGPWLAATAVIACAAGILSRSGRGRK